MRLKYLLAGLLAVGLSGGFARAQTPAVGGTCLGTANCAAQLDGSGTAGSFPVLARTLAAEASDATNVLNILPQASSATDYTSTINTALAKAPVPVYLPNTGTPYTISNTLSLPAFATLQCAPGVVIQAGASFPTNGELFTTTGASASIIGCKFEGAGYTVAGGFVNQDHFLWQGGGGNRIGQVSITGSGATYDSIQNAKFTNGLTTAISIANNAFRTSVINTEFENNVGFGIWLNTGSNNSYLLGNWTDSNGIELIGQTYQAYNSQIIGNRATGTGDNGISISGYGNTITGNRSVGNAFAGIWIYGSGNTVTGNYALDNGQVHNPAFRYYNSSATGLYAGIAVNGNFGGYAQNNTVVGNAADDDQVTPTQYYGVDIGIGYAAWAANTNYALNAYAFANGNIYEVTFAGMSSSVAPSCTSGSCIDGTVTWEYISTPLINTREPTNNMVGPNHTYRSAGFPFRDQTVNRNNTVATDNYTAYNPASSQGSTTYSVFNAGFSSNPENFWTSGSTIHAGELVYTASGANLYRVTVPNSSGITTVQPTNTSGTATTSDGITWLFLTTGEYYPNQIFNGQGVAMGNAFAIPVMDSATATIQVYAGTGSPNSKVAAVVGSIYLRSDGGPGTSVYIKETGTNYLGWNPVESSASAPLVGTSSAIGGSLLAAGACASTTVAITGLTTAMDVHATPVTFPGAGMIWQAYASAAGTATVEVCAIIAGTPTSSAYNVRVIQ